MNIVAASQKLLLHYRKLNIFSQLKCSSLLPSMPKVSRCTKSNWAADEYSDVC